MCKRLVMLFGAVLMLSGCSFFQDQVPLPPLQSCSEVPLCCDEFHRPYLEVAQRVPGFGGLFVDFDDNRILYVYLTDLSQEEAVKQVVREIFGPRWLELHMYPQEIRVLQGQYNYVQLREWSSCISKLLVVPGITSVGIEMSKNRVTIGIDIGLKAEKKRRVIEAIETALERLGIPREAVILEEMPPAVPKQKNPGGDLLLRNVFGATTLLAQDCTETVPVVSGTTNRIGLETADPTYFTGGACPAGQRCRYSDSAFAWYYSAHRVAANVAGGDSGSPVFKITNSPQPRDVELRGVLFGGQWFLWWVWFWFSHIGDVEYELGSLTVCAPGFAC